MTTLATVSGKDADAGQGRVIRWAGSEKWVTWVTCFAFGFAAGTLIGFLIK